MEAQKEIDNVPSTHADQGKVLDKDPGAGGKEDASEGTQEDPGSSSRAQ